MSSIAVIVTTPPTSNLTNSAINLVRAALESNINVIGVFFYQQGVLNAAKKLAIPNDETQNHKHWQELHSIYQTPLHLCSTAAEKHGLIDESDEKSLINPAFTLSGLGELVTLTSKAERVIQL